MTSADRIAARWRHSGNEMKPAAIRLAGSPALAGISALLDVWRPTRPVPRYSWPVALRSACNDPSNGAQLNAMARLRGRYAPDRGKYAAPARFYARAAQFMPFDPAPSRRVRLKHRPEQPRQRFIFVFRHRAILDIWPVRVDAGVVTDPACKSRRRHVVVARPQLSEQEVEN